MKLTEMKIGLKRDVRLAKYNVSQCSVELTAQLSPEDDPQVVYEELVGDVEEAVSDMAKNERKNYTEALKNAHKDQSKK